MDIDVADLQRVARGTGPQAQWAQKKLLELRTFDPDYEVTYPQAPTQADVNWPRQGDLPPL